MKRILAGLVILLAVSGSAAAQDKLVIAHRGAAGYLPEHTLAGYAYAYALGADFIETDLVMTRDAVFICVHDVTLELTTDVEQIYPDRHRRDGHWYAADFTLEEIRQLRVHERTSSSGSPAFAGRFPLDQSAFSVPTFVEVIELVQGLNRSTGRAVGLYPELKRPSWHADEGLPMEVSLLEVLEAAGYSGSDASIYVQCFEAETLRTLRFQYATELQLIQLISSSWSYSAMWTDAGLEEIAQYADGIGPSKSIIETNPSYVSWAHHHDLVVHPYTFRADDLPSGYASLDEELNTFFFEYGVDGVFTDFPDAAIRVLEEAFVQGAS